MKGYYDIKDDISRYKKAWLYMVLSARGPGKTYSVLKYCINKKVYFLYLKRTKKDVNLMCKNQEFSPFKALNRDGVCNVVTEKLDDGIGAFYEGEEKKLIGYTMSLANISDIKGFDLSECDYLIMDEFIPMQGTRVLRSEGETLLDIYDTLKRDRKKKGKDPLKLILYGNPVNLMCPIMRALGLIDTVYKMQHKGNEYFYDEYLGIMIHRLDSSKYYIAEQEDDGIDRLMKGTAWYSANRDGVFGFNDFTKVGKKSLKGYKPVFEIRTDREKSVCYKRGNQLYFCDSPTNHTIPVYDFRIETDCEKFLDEVYFRMHDAIVDERVLFQKSSVYDLIFHFKKYF